MHKINILINIILQDYFSYLSFYFWCADLALNQKKQKQTGLNVLFYDCLLQTSL